MAKNTVSLLIKIGRNYSWDRDCGCERIGDKKKQYSGDYLIQLCHFLLQLMTVSLSCLISLLLSNIFFFIYRDLGMISFKYLLFFYESGNRNIQYLIIQSFQKPLPNGSSPLSTDYHQLYAFVVTLTEWVNSPRLQMNTICHDETQALLHGFIDYNLFWVIAYLPSYGTNPAKQLRYLRCRTRHQQLFPMCPGSNHVHL